MSEEIEIDQGVYDAMIAAGKSERIARAKAKAATVRARKKADGVEIGPISADAWKEKKANFSVSAGGGGGGGGGGTATALKEAPSGRLTPQERAARVAASLGNGNGAPASPGVPVSGDHTHRLLALVPPGGIQQVSQKQMDKVYTWPHLLIVEFVALLAMTAFVLVVSFFLDAPLGSLANQNITPNPSKAPWYFMGLQELLRYFHPMVAGVTIPGVGLIVLGATAYFDKNPSARPENRKFASMAYTWFLMLWMVLVLIGSFFRGPGFNWIWPWVDGLYFEL